MGNKKFIFISLLILAIGFAAVSTTLYITGNLAYQTKKNNFDVYFSGAEIDNVDLSNIVIKDKKHIEYTSNELKKINDTSVLKYEVTNDSTEYDATVTISCIPMKTAYFDVTLNPVTFDIDAGEVKTDEIEAKLIRVSEVEQNISIDCELSVVAKERTSIESIVEHDDNYKISGVLTTSENESLNRKKVLVKSDRNIVKTDLHGYFYVEGLERGRHHIYYKEDGDYEISDEELEEYLIAEVSTNGYLKIINKNYKINNFQYSTALVDEGTYCELNIGKTWEYNYDENKLNGQDFKVDDGCTGTYKIELWGSGAMVRSNQLSNTVGKGAYTSGEIHLNELTQLYVYVGAYTYNNAQYTSEQPGGGATDVRLVNGNWDNIQSLKSRIMVAAGGGGGMYEYGISAVNAIGHAGGLKGYSAAAVVSQGGSYSNIYNTTAYSGKGATQTQGGAAGTYGYDTFVESMNGSFGIGGSCNGRASGGGGGYYGGGHGRHPGSTHPGGGGGSSFISGHTGCVAIADTGDTSEIKPRLASDKVTECADDTTDIECSKHYSGLFFENTVMIDGKGCIWTTVNTNRCNGMPNTNGTQTEIGHSSTGHAKITLISLD